MAVTDSSQTSIIKHLEGLTPDMIQEVIDFIDFLKIKKTDKYKREIGALLLQQESLQRIWESEVEDLYEL
ncbi:MAG: hypothetical protein R6T98_07055 [Desulfatiglandales bacterium]